tara:strand:+ start:1022 stop:1186 length:165 start_codon:yes stop_codon:yes gene_type:complete
MTTLAQNSEYKVEFNGGSTYMIVDNHGTCLMVKSTERTAVNYFNKVSINTGIKN